MAGLSKYTASPFEQGPAGMTTAENDRRMESARDFFQGRADFQDEEMKRKATGAMIAEAMASGVSIEEIQARRPDLFTNPDPNADIGAVAELFQNRLNTASVLDVNASGVRANDSQTAFNDVRTEAYPGESKAEIALRKAQADASRASTRSSNAAYDALAREEEKRRVLEEKVGKYREYWYGGGMDAERDNAWQEHLKVVPADMTEAELAMEKPQFMKSYKATLVDGENGIPKLAARFGMSVPEFLRETELGRSSQLIGDTLAKEQAVIAAQTEADRLEKRKARTALIESGDPRNIVADGDGNLTWGLGGVQINDLGANDFADSIGLDIKDKDTIEVIKTAKSLFPNIDAFKVALSRTKGKKGTLKKDAQDILRTAANNLYAAAGDDLAAEKQSVYTAGTPEEESLRRIMRNRQQNAEKEETPKEVDPAALTTEQFQEQLTARKTTKQSEFVKNYDTTEKLIKALRAEPEIGWWKRNELTRIEQNLKFLQRMSSQGSGQKDNLYAAQDAFIAELKALQQELLDEREAKLK